MENDFSRFYSRKSEEKWREEKENRYRTEIAVLMTWKWIFEKI